MKRSILIIIVLLFKLISCNNNDQPISKHEMKIVSIPWSIITRIPITEEAIWTIERADSTIIEDQRFINEIRSKLDELNKTTKDNHVDVRISVLIQRAEHETDTLSFGKNKIIKLNSDYYEWNDSLFEEIISKVSVEHKTIIQKYF